MHRNLRRKSGTCLQTLFAAALRRLIPAYPSINPFDALSQSATNCLSFRRGVNGISDKSRFPEFSPAPANVGLHSPISHCGVEAGKSHNKVIAVCPNPHLLSSPSSTRLKMSVAHRGRSLGYFRPFRLWFLSFFASLFLWVSV